ncbi:MAG: alternative ribosome rescue aminoacyl-tRNA hydrolase ArfB [Syntrophobacteraceae bacterium]|nr:alternative ribosome rescue aminoacyl-tRNA hydrolase ArfB [Syntrophobacteraceae bacterium]
MIMIDEHIAISEDELVFTASHASGPGGQNVNKLNSRVTLWFDVVNSPGLSVEQKALLMRRLANRIGKDGVLRVISQQTRSQAANRELAVHRFVELVRDALREIPKRKRTRVSRAARLRRVEEKRRQSTQKQKRSKNIRLDD